MKGAEERKTEEKALIERLLVGNGWLFWPGIGGVFSVSIPLLVFFCASQRDRYLCVEGNCRDERERKREVE